MEYEGSRSSLESDNETEQVGRTTSLKVVLGFMCVLAITAAGLVLSRHADSDNGTVPVFTPVSPVVFALLPTTTTPVPAGPRGFLASQANQTSPVVRSTPVIPAAAAPVNMRRAPRKSVLPDEHMHDGNICDDTEELLAGLCYTKCSILTNSTHAHRFSAFSCCETEDCHANVFKMKTASLIPCSGFDVSSADGGIACPHLRGTCLTDEEQFLGECYEKCSTLTNGTYPNRVAAMSCCNTEGVGCLDPFNEWTKPAFFAGGGNGDHNAETPRKPHFPEKVFAEAV